MKTINPYRALTKPVEITPKALTVIDNLDDGDLLVVQIGSEKSPADWEEADYLCSTISRVISHKRVGVLVVPYIYKIHNLELK